LIIRKKFFLIFPLLAALFVLAVISPGHCQSNDKILEQLKLELKSEGVSDEFIKVTAGSLKRMIAAQAPSEQIKIVLLDLWNQKVKGRALKNAVSAVAELVESGDNVLEASNIASGAAHKAEAEGLSGFGVGMRVRKAVQDRKAYLKSLKE
jgi:hypothetical protein